MGTEETKLVIDALRRDLERFAHSDDFDRRNMIKERMIDSIESIGYKADRGNVVETVVKIVNGQAHVN